jgi:CDP-diacylglycerol--serine O-phosphatidyltransferase
VISFGVAPAALLYRWSLAPVGALGVFACFAFVSAGVLRLARFNLLSMQESGAPRKPGKYILGLPIPGAAGIVVSLVVANHAASGNLAEMRLTMFALALILSGCMVSTIRFRSFKDMRLTLGSVLSVGVVALSALAVALEFAPEFALVWLLLCYVALGLAEAAFHLSARRLRLVRARRHSEGESSTRWS